MIINFLGIDDIKKKTHKTLKCLLALYTSVLRNICFPNLSLSFLVNNCAQYLLCSLFFMSILLEIMSCVFFILLIHFSSTYCAF